MKRDFRAKSHIVFSVGSAALKYVRGSTTAFEAWQRLCAAFEDKGVHRRLALLDQLLDARQTNYSSLENYVYGVKEIVTKIQETGKPIEDGLSAMKLLKGLNAEYKWLRQLIERTRTIPDGSGDTILAFDTVVEELLREAQKEDAEKSNKAAVAVPSSNMGASPRWQPYHRGGRGGFRGGRGGHRGGHSGLRGGRGGSQHTTPTDRQRGQKGTGTGAFPTCKFCKRSNHPERDCWFNPASPQYKLGGHAGASTSTSTSGQQRPAATGPPKWKVAIAKRACDEVGGGSTAKVLRADVETNSNKNISFYLDSGSFDNLISDPTCIKNYKTYPRESIECAGDQILHTEGAGTILLDPEHNNGLSEIQVKYVPGLSSNLLSVSTIAKSNLVTIFIDNFGGVFC
ncbi:hypothetical protein ONE63_008039 [Megalurothrips usitatus]|uniref:Retrovirus-related Pol polyprotein from transposon TNT 1-94-like beta-barrel domain-containing protein n=1 Tax=Megalurothrips usitatus TaxID=439358 RepID=A0AAV7XQN3_9NEOP|nr:hypothetical protein ONE63_008039 [Megalurothrips usitatus]